MDADCEQHKVLFLLDAIICVLIHYVRKQPWRMPFYHFININNININKIFFFLEKEMKESYSKGQTQKEV
jgi:hypothetical protein